MGADGLDSATRFLVLAPAALGGLAAVGGAHLIAFDPTADGVLRRSRLLPPLAAAAAIARSVSLAQRRVAKAP